ncbi:MAG TPA: acetyl-CoA hydrolase/transferase C-terminal domain-containing protein [Candidatus Binatia bacterium]|nr:acetyl-CoA hydrolase/transferase C-terminal domain-containing protein [Candidatus Binatia bacterium]
MRSPAEAAELLHATDDLLLPLAPAQPAGFLRALARRDDLRELRIWCALLQERFDVLSRPGVRVISQFFGGVERQLRAEGVAVEHLTADFHGFELIARRMRPRVVACATSPPDDDGWLSFGVHAGAGEVPFREAAADPARLAVAEVNPQMPRTRGVPEFGDHRIHASEVDVIVEHDEALHAPEPRVSDEADRRIAALVGDLVPDGATLQFGIGGIPNAIARELAEGPHRDFGIHTELLVDGVKLLHDAGKIANRKGIYDGLTVCTFALGTRALYDWAEREPSVRFLPVSATNPPAIIRRNRRMVSVNSAVMIDLYGQVVADSVPGRQYSGVGGHESFVTGARECDEGASILCLHATASVRGEKRSRIVAELPPGSVVTTPRHQVQWVATENGIVNLFGLAAGRRARALAALADADFRDELAAGARRV